ncbi:hypothetical protein CFP56_022276 [Quercus suber]|uniref:DUF4283 domain-containing protein n=1 Tax=Quercus suber TaxID=58331 RepID=A0AAW0KCM4_QUESU
MGCKGQNRLRIKVELDSWMQPDYFPVLTDLSLASTGIVTIPESISRFTRLLPSGNSKTSTIYKNCGCNELQSAGYTIIKQIIESGILSNTVAEAATSFNSKGLQIGKDHYLILPVTDIPKWLKFNHHQRVGNSVSFLVDPKFSNLVVCIVFPSEDVAIDIGFMWDVEIFINVKKQITSMEWWRNSSYDHVWLMYSKVNISNPSEENRIEVVNASVALRNPIYLMPHLWINVLSTMEKKIQAVLESDANCGEETFDHARRPQKQYLSSFGWLRIQFQLWKRSSKPWRQRITTGFHDQGSSSIPNTFLNDDTNANLYPPSKKTKTC